MTRCAGIHLDSENWRKLSWVQHRTELGIEIDVLCDIAHNVRFATVLVLAQYSNEDNLCPKYSSHSSLVDRHKEIQHNGNQH